MRPFVQVVSFDVPEELSRAHAQLSPRAVTLDQLADTMEQSGVGLTVVHSQPPNDEHGDEVLAKAPLCCG